MEDRVHRNLSDEDIQKIAGIYHAWRGEEGIGEYKDIKGFCKSAELDEVRKRDYILTPGIYVGLPEEEDDGIPFEEKMKKLTTELSEQMKGSQRLNEEIKMNLEKIGFRME